MPVPTPPTSNRIPSIVVIILPEPNFFLGGVTRFVILGFVVASGA